MEEPLSIAFLKYFAADNVRNADNDPCRPAPAAATGKTVGIIGGGPGGLTAAYFLALKGHAVTVYDAMPQMGGMLRYGIPAYRLPKDVLDAEIADVAALGVKLVNNFKIGQDETFDAFRARFDAVIVAIGAWRSSGVGCEGDKLPGVVGGIDILRQVALGERPDLGKHVVIVGGGNTAMDACRTAVRLGAEDVTVVYRRTRAEMPAEDVEIEEAMEEGVKFHFLASPAEIIAGADGKAAQLKLQIMELGEPDASGRRAPVPVEGQFEILPVDTVIAAIGQKVNPAGFEAVELNKRGIIAADETTFRTNLDNVFAVGDATNKGAGIAIAAIGEANKAAEVVDSFLNGAVVPYSKPYVSERQVDESNFADKERLPRIQMPTRPAEERKHDFLPVNLGFDEALARKEAKRCLECGCHDYGECKLIKYADCDCVNCNHFCGDKHKTEKETKLVTIERNRAKCILCGACVRVCEEKVGKGILGLVGRGFTTVIKPEFNDGKVTTDFCAGCMECADNCPTGALKIIG